MFCDEMFRPGEDIFGALQRSGWCQPGEAWHSVSRQALPLLMPCQVIPFRPHGSTFHCLLSGGQILTQSRVDESVSARRPDQTLVPAPVWKSCPRADGGEHQHWRTGRARRRQADGNSFSWPQNADQRPFCPWRRAGPVPADQRPFCPWRWTPCPAPSSCRKAFPRRLNTLCARTAQRSLELQTQLRNGPRI